MSAPGSETAAAAAASSPAAPRAVPSEAELAKFYALVDKARHAGSVGRFALGVELSEQAAAEAARLLGADSVAVATLHTCTAKCLHNRAAIEKVENPFPFAQRAFEELLKAVAVLSPRLADGTLLPGRCRPEESEFWASAFLERMPPSLLFPGDHDASRMPAIAAAAGYISAVSVADVGLSSLVVCRWPDSIHPEQARVEQFVLDVLDLMAATAAVSSLADSNLTCEAHFAARFDEIDPARLEPNFAHAVFAKWNSAPVRAVRQARSLLTDPLVATIASQMALVEEAMRKQADVARRGLHACALPGCGRVEARACVPTLTEQRLTACFPRPRTAPSDLGA